MRVGVPFSADVPDSGILQQPRDQPCAHAVFRGLGHNQIPVKRLGRRSAFLSLVTPFRVIVPVHEPDQRIVNLIYEPPHPVPPEWVEALNRGSTDTWPSGPQPALQRSHDGPGRLLVDAAILFKGNPPADPFVVWLIPDAPEPVAHGLTTPLFDAVPSQL